MKTLRRFLCLLTLLLVVHSVVNAQNRFYLKNGDRVVFYGDSITDQRLYTTFVETYVVTRFPDLNLSFVHSGWGGDRVTGGGGGIIDKRLQRDVIAYKPTVVTVMLGMNDGGYRAFDPALFNTFSNGYRHIVQTLKTALPALRMTLIQPSPYDDVTRAPTFEGGYNAVLVRYGQFLKELAQQQSLDVADLNTPVVAAIVKANATDAALAQKIIPDRIHPLAGGHLLMAAALLKAWNVPAVVTMVEIDAASKRVLRSDNTKVTDVSGGGAISWMQVDRALPLPYDMNDPVLALAVRSSDVVESLNQEPLKVMGLNEPRYVLRIDGEEVGTFTKEQLAEGINLAVLPTPMRKQAMDVHGLTLKHNNVHYARWRNVQAPLQDQKLPTLQKAIDILDSLEAEVVKQQRAAAQPKTHRYELVPKTS